MLMAASTAPCSHHSKGTPVTHTWLDDMFGVRKPVIAMLHLSALPGDPAYDSVDDG
jgi:hypothetical protein